MPRIEGNAELVDAIYVAALDAKEWPRVLDRFTHFFGGSSAHLSVDYVAMMPGMMISVGSDPDYARRYGDYYAARNVLWQRWLRQPPSTILTDRTVMPKEELRRSEFYSDFLHPQDGDELLISMAWQQPDRAASLTLWRPERLGPWEREHMKALETLTPHLRRALQVNQSIGDLRLTRDLASEALQQLDQGVILADAHAQLLFANRAAQEMLSDAGGVYAEGRRLAARRASDNTALRRLIAGAAAGGDGGSLLIHREMRPSLIVIVMPPTAAFPSLFRRPLGAIIFIKDIERPAALSLTAFAQYFDLTPAQCALAHEMIRGDGVRAAATRLGISYATARTHLLQIFQKTGAARQAELVRLILEWNEASVIAENTKPSCKT